MTASVSSPPVLAKPRPGLLRLYLVYLVILLIPASFLLTFFVNVIPRFKEIFKDFRTTLPLVTQWTMAISAVMTDYYLWIPALLLALALPVIPALITQRQSDRLKRVIYVLITVIVTFLITQIISMLAAWSLFAPLIKLIQSVSGGENDGG